MGRYRNGGDKKVLDIRARRGAGVLLMIAAVVSDAFHEPGKDVQYQIFDTLVPRVPCTLAPAAQAVITVASSVEGTPVLNP